MEQLNIEGRRSGNGFVAHRDTFLKSLSLSQSERLEIIDCIVGRRGFLSYLKALGGSNVVKVVPQNGEGKGIKVVVGSNEGFIPDGAWIRAKMPYTLSQARVSPHNGVYPNLSGIELAEALARTLPFTRNDKDEPAFSKVAHFRQAEGKLVVVVTTRHRLAEVTLDAVDGEGAASIDASQLKSLVGAVRRAKRVRVSVDEGIIIDTELIRYRYPSLDVAYPEWTTLIPTDLDTRAYFDSKEAIRASQSLGAMWIRDTLKPQYNTLILKVGDNRLTLIAEGNNSQAHIPADTEGEAVIAIQARYLTQALKVSGGMATLKVKDERSPMLFETDGYRLLVMPMLDVPQVAEVKEQRTETKPKRKRKAKAAAEPAKEPEPVTA